MQSWRDEFLQWNESHYGTEQITVDSKRIWRPEVLIRNRSVITD